MAVPSLAPAQPTSHPEAPSLVAWAAITLLCLGASAAFRYATRAYTLWALETPEQVRLAESPLAPPEPPAARR